MEDLITVIVPVYNSGQYISSCVESVLVQTYSLFELILIEDGSEDNSLEICEKLREKDKRIQLIRQEHKGVSAARNLGIEAAKGKYLFFLDSDDLIHPKLLETLYKLQEEEKTAIASVGVYYRKEGNLKEIVVWGTDSKNTLRNLYLDNQKAVKHIISPVVCAIGGKMISRKAINSIRFTESLSYSEDMMFIYQLLEKGADISILHCDWYFYRKRKNSASEIFSLKTCKDRYRVGRYICDCEERCGREENAIYREWNLIALMMEWLETGRAQHDIKLIRYVENLVGKERKREIFQKLRWWMKLYFYLIVYCYPISGVIWKIARIGKKCWDSLMEDRLS